MSEQDAFRCAAAKQYGFESVGDGKEYRCTEAQLIAFAKVCECKGMFQAQEAAVDVQANRKVSHFGHDFQAGFKHGAFVVARRLGARIDEMNAELTPIREPCEYCGPGKSTGLPGNACENCMNTGLKYPTAEDLR